MGVVGKQLSALLQILRSNGVTRYQTPEITLDIGPAPPPKPGPRALELSPEALAREALMDDDDEPGDMRFALERIGPKHFPPAKADPRKNKVSQ